MHSTNQPHNKNKQIASITTNAEDPTPNSQKPHSKPPQIPHSRRRRRTRTTRLKPKSGRRAARPGGRGPMRPRGTARCARTRVRGVDA
jgi:hypothetical protein